MIGDLGDSKVTIEKNNLLEKIRTNRNKHVAEYEEAFAGFRLALIKELEDKLVDAKAGKEVSQVLEASAPHNHTEDYDCVISMLEMSVSTEITITEQQFKQYVLDKWNWQAAFKASTAMYKGNRR